MAKEPAAIMLPSVFAFLVFLKRNSMDKRLWYRFAAIALLMLAAGAAWVILNPALQGRQGIPNESMAVILKSFILPRWNFYAAALTTPSSLIVLVATLFLVFQHLLKSRIKSPIQIICLSLLAALCAAFLLKMAPAIALATLITSMTLLLLVSHPAGLGTAGTIPAILGLMTISYVIRTYLVEASFGLALICGLALNECRLALPLRGMSKASGRMKSVIALAMTALAAFGLLIITPSLSEKISALRLLCANRQTLSMTLDYLKKSPPLPGPLLVIDYTDMGLLYERDILPMDDRSKAARQKTMSSFSMNAFLQPILGMPVRNFSSWRTNDFEHAVAVVLTMNPSEETFLEKLPLHAEKLREWIQGDARAALYRIDRLASGGN